MDQFEKQQRKREARHRLHAQRRRVGLLRTRVITVSLISFAVLWGAVFVQMATGNDPVLGDRSPTAARGSGRPDHSHAATEPRAAEVPEPDLVEEVEESREEKEFVEDVPAEEEFVEGEPAEGEFIEEEPAPVTTAQS